MFPNLKLIRWAPLCPLHGKTHLDRRFSSITSWINKHQLSARITSINHMNSVLIAGARGANKKRRELGDKPIPTTFSIFKLQPPGAKNPYIELDNISSILAITYIPKLRDRLSSNDSGYYINTFPWIPWQRGKRIPMANICDGSKAEVRTAKQRKLRSELKPAGSLDREDYSRLEKQHDNRLKLVENMGLNVKEMLSHSF